MGGRTSQLQVRVTPEEKAALKRLAARAGQNVSTYVLSRCLSAPDRDLSRVLEQFRHDGDLWEGAAALMRFVSELGPEGAEPALDAAKTGGLSPLAQNLVAAVAEDFAHATATRPPDWTSSVPPLSRPQFRWGLVSLRPEQLRRTRAAFKRRNVFDASSRAPAVTPSSAPQELAQLTDDLAFSELDVEFYFVGGAVLHQVLAATARSSRPAEVLRGGQPDTVARLTAEHAKAFSWVAEHAREIVGPGAPPGRFLEVPHLRVFAAPAEYVLAVKIACAPADQSQQDLGDLGFLLRALNVTTESAALAAITPYVAQRHLPSHAQITLRRLLGA